VTDFNVEIRIRNAHLLRLIRAKFGTAAAASRASGVSQQTICAWMTMRESPFLKDGSPCNAALDLCAVLGCTPEDAWPAHMAKFQMKRNSAEVEMSAAEVMAIAGSPESSVIQRQLIARWARNLRPREIEAVGLMQSGATLDEAGKALGVTRERVRQIHLKALNKMRRAATIDGIKSLEDAQ
jgi:predicted DNA-binding protein (UPF0251 family)